MELEFCILFSEQVVKHWYPELKIRCPCAALALLANTKAVSTAAAHGYAWTYTFVYFKEIK